MKKTRPRIVQEFVEKLALLQKEKPLEAPVSAVITRILADGPSAQ